MVNYGKWLNQFNDEHDKYYAEKLVGSLCVFDTTDIENALVGILNNRFNTPNEIYALYPIMSAENLPEKKFDTKREYLSLIQEHTINNDPKKNDSELLVRVILKNYCENNIHKCKFMPDKDSIRKDKSKNIILFTDSIGSGDEVIKFIKNFIKDKTICSYISRGNIKKIFVVAHMSTSKAKEKIQKTKVYKKSNFIEVINERESRTIDSYFKENERHEIKKLCKKYCKSSKKTALGYKNTGLLSIYSYKIQNNAPKILTTCKSKQWYPLFDGRRVDKDDFEKSIKAESPSSLLILFNIIGRFKKNIKERLSEQLSISIGEASEFITKAIDIGYITDTYSITPLGRKKINSLKKVQNRYTENKLLEIERRIALKYRPYYKG